MALESDRIVEPPDSLTAEYARSRSKADVNLLELCTTLARRKRAIAKTTIGLVVLAVLMSFVWPASFTAQTVILPPPQNQSFANMLAGQLNLLATLGVKDIGLKNSVDLYSAVLASQSVNDGLIRKFNLMDVYHVKTMEATRKVLEHRTTIKPMQKEGLIRISVRDHDPKRASDLANGYVDQLQRLNERLALTESSQRRLFLEQQLRQAKENLIVAEQTLQQTQQKTGMLQLDTQAKAIIATVANLRGEIAAQEVQVQAMKSFATNQNPDLVLAEEQLAGLRKQLAKVLHENNVTEGDIEIPTSRLPEASLAYLRAYRNVKYNETLYEILAKQYEAARLDEAKSASLAQVVDPATVPERKSFPPALILVIIGALFAGFFLGCAFVIVQEAYRRFTADPANREQIDVLKSYLVGRS